jgi:hypothetical protein
VSQFAEDLASQQVERELESELAQQEALQVPQAAAAEPAMTANEDVADEVEQQTLPGLPEEVRELEPAEPNLNASAPSDTTPDEAAVSGQAEQTRPTFADREWQIFRASMSQFVDPVRFAEIFSALRGLRNQEVFDLTNNELKELVKQAINRGMLQRTGRGARAYYRLSSQYRIAQDAVQEDESASSRPTASARSTSTPTPQAPSEQREDPATDNTTVEAAAGQVTDTGLAPAARRRRGRSYDASAQGAASEGSDTAAAPRSTNDGHLELQDTVADQMAVQLGDEAAPAKPRRNRRKKATTPTEAEPAIPAPVETAAEAPQPTASDNDQSQAGNGAKKRRTRRKKTSPGEEGIGSPEAASE